MQEPVKKPGQITEADFARFELITQGNVHDILEAIKKGDREELNGYYLGYNDYLTLAGWMEQIERYIREAESHFAEEERRYDVFLTQQEKADDGE